MSVPNGAGGAAVVAADLRKVYGARRGLLRRPSPAVEGLRGISLAIRRGELFGLLGPNGAGKTTTVKILTTLLLPTSGTATVLGLDVTRRTDEVRSRIGFVLGGERGLYTRLSAWDNLRYFAILYRVPPRVARTRIPELLELTGLRGREHEPVERYSRGMKQRLHLAKGLINDPAVLFLDEPTIGLDPVGALELRAFVRGLADRGRTILLTTHHLLEADAICDRLAVIDGGRIVAEGTPAELKRRVAHLGVVVFEATEVPDAAVAALRAQPGVASVTVAERELQLEVRVRCDEPARLAARLGSVLGGLPVSAVHITEPTLEDAYVGLVARGAAP